jgi:hypothetical protein
MTGKDDWDESIYVDGMYETEGESHAIIPPWELNQHSDSRGGFGWGSVLLVAFLVWGILKVLGVL